MKTRKRKRLSLWVKRLFLTSWGLAVSAGAALGQDNRPVAKSYLNKGTVHLPIQIDDRVRPQIQEVQLFVKDSAQAPWILKERVPGTQPFFTFRTPQEGEFWFSVVTVDRNGRTIPADVSKEPPGLIVVIDSTPPQPDVQIMSITAEGQQIRCEVRDANPDTAKTRFFYQTRDQIWRTLEAVSGQADTYCIPAQAALTGMVRVVAGDLAGNSTTREFNLATLPVAANTMPAHPAPLTTAPVLTPTPSAAVPPGPVPSAKGLSNVVIVDALEKLPPSMAPDVTPAPAKTPGPVVVNEPIVSVPEVVVSSKSSPAPQAPSLEPASKTPFSAPSTTEIRNVADTLPAAVTRQIDVPAKRHLVNNSHVFLDYQVEQTGVSGVGRVEIWYTRNMGQNWQKLGEDANHKGQAEIDLPGEGVYGVTIVVANGRGFGATPPRSGDTPDWWIEVDSTKPQAELLNVRTNPSGEDGTLQITWTAKDKNLHAEPVDLYYAVNRQGPWLPIAKGLKNDGAYNWTPAATIGTHAFVRLTVHDQAGNTASCESLQPVALDDMSRPRGRVIGVTTIPRTNIGNGPAASPPSGN